jgi:hypothetical protein
MHKKQKMKRHMAIASLLLLIFVSGCTHKANTNLSITDINYAAEGTAGKELQITIQAASPSDFENVAVAVSAVSEEEENDSIDIDETEIKSLKAGEETYTLNITLPRDLEAGSYTLIAHIDPADLLGDWKDSLQFKEGSERIEISKLTSDEIAFSTADDDSNASATLSQHSDQYATDLSGTLPPITINYTDENLSLGLNAILHPYLAQAEQIDLNVTACLGTAAGCATRETETEVETDLANTAQLAIGSLCRDPEIAAQYGDRIRDALTAAST